MSYLLPGRDARLRASALAAALSCLAAAPVSAQVVAAAEPVVITASRSPQPASRVLADVTVLERDAIERSGASCLADLLARVPGVELSRNGGPAGTTGLFLRGAETRHTAVYIDGLRVDDQGTRGAPWELMPLAEVERVEVLRGPAAAVYGSEAVAGVVQLFTRRGQGATRATAALSYGAQQTVQGSASVSGGTEKLDYALSASHARGDGFNAMPAGNPDRDGWKRSGLQARVGAEVATGHRVEAALLAGNLRGQYDGFTAGQDDVARQQLRTLQASWQGRWSAQSSSRVQLGESRVNYESQPSYYRTETTLRHLLLQHEQRVGDQLWTVLAERREDELLNPATAFVATLAADRHQDALALGWRLDAGAHTVQANVRHDQDSEFGGKATGNLAWGWQFAPGWRTSASVGTSFRAPTLYQRFSEYGNATLGAETGRNVEVGVRWTSGVHELGATAWNNRVRNLIAFGSAGLCASAFGCYENVGRARYEGVTLSGRTRVAGVALNGSLDWHDPRNQVTDKLLQRRARLLGSFSADTDWAGWHWGAELQGQGQRWENAANTQRLGGYALLNLRAERALARGLLLQARIDNVADKPYELARGYATAGRTAQLGLRWAL